MKIRKNGRKNEGLISDLGAAPLPARKPDWLRMERQGGAGYNEMKRLLRQAELNVNTMQNRIFIGSHAAVATIDVSGPFEDETSERLLSLPEVMRVVVTANAE